MKRLLAGETLAYQGRFSKSEKVVLNVLPHEGRVPPIYVAVLARDAAYHVGKQANRIFTVPYASCKDFDDIGTMLAEYRRGRRRPASRPRTTTTSSRCTPTSPKPTPRRAAQCKAAYDLYVDTRLYAKKHIYEDIIANGICLFGSADTVTQKMRRLHEMGVRHVATLQNFGALAPALVEKSMTLFAREVMPNLP